MKTFVTIAAAMLLACGSAIANPSQEANVATSDEKAEVPASVEMLQVAGQLLKYGYAQQEALPLIQAVDLYKAVGIGALEGQQKAEEVEAGVTEGSKTSKVTFDVDKILADATDFADGDEHYLALITDLKQSATRGATKNYAVHYDTVKARATDTYTISFRGGERACVVVSGDGDTDLDLYVYDQNGNLIDNDLSYGDDCLCVWNPRWTGPFTIKVVNRGRVYNRYSLAVN